LHIHQVYHGYPFSGSYPNTTWPGYSTFAYRFSNMHGPRQPTWEYYDDYMNWTARMQYVAQTGTPKIDLAFWLKKTQFFDKASQYRPNDLVEAGKSLLSSHINRSIVFDTYQAGHMSILAPITSSPNPKPMFLMESLHPPVKRSRLSSSVAMTP
jgi:hypothetical protein